MITVPDLASSNWWPFAAAIGGFIVGWLANLAIHFLPLLHEGNLPFGSCASCGAPRRFVDTLATTRYLARGGRCRRCRAYIPLAGPIVEIGNLILWVLMAARYPPTVNTLVLMFFVTALLTLAVIDMQHFLLPDAITLPGIVAGVASTWLPGWSVSRLDSALSAAIGYFAMMVLAKAAERYYREEALGQGDWKMVAMLGAFLGASKTITGVLIANGVGAVFGLMLVMTSGERGGRRKLPLGTFLGASGILMAFW